MKGSKAVRTHLSTQKVQNSFEKSAKQRKPSKNLYTLNKQSDDDQVSNQTQQIHQNHQHQKASKKSKHHSYQPQSSPSSQSTPSQSNEREGHDVKTAGNTKIKLKLNQENLSHHDDSHEVSLASSDDKQELHEEQRIQKYFSSDQNDKSFLKLHMTIKQLQQENNLLNQSLLAHQNRQKDMIFKFAKLQAQNKKLHYQIIKIQKSQKQTKSQFTKIQHTKKEIQTFRNANQQILAFIQTENMRIISYIKTLVGKLITEEQPHPQSINKQSKSISEYLDKSLSTLKQNRKKLFKKFPLINDSYKENQSINLQGNYQASNGQIPTKEQKQKQSQYQNFDFSYERERILQLNEQILKLNNQINKFKEQFKLLSESYKKSTLEKVNQIESISNQLKDKESQLRQQKGQICEKYNQAIQQLKAKYKTLQKKIEEQQQKNESKINELQKGLSHKDKVIRKLKEQLKEMNVKLQEFEEERFELQNSNVAERERKVPYQSKKKFIDGDLLNSSLNSNKEKSFLKDFSLPKQPYHEESFYEYQPERRKKKNHWNQDEDPMMRKSHKTKKMTVKQRLLSEDEMDIKKLDKQIEKLERQVLKQFQNSN